MKGLNSMELCHAALIDLINMGFKHTKGFEGIIVQSVEVKQQVSGNTIKLNLVMPDSKEELAND